MNAKQHIIKEVPSEPQGGVLEQLQAAQIEIQALTKELHEVRAELEKYKHDLQRAEQKLQVSSKTICVLEDINVCFTGTFQFRQTPAGKHETTITYPLPLPRTLQVFYALSSLKIGLGIKDKQALGASDSHGSRICFKVDEAMSSGRGFSVAITVPAEDFWKGSIGFGWLTLPSNDIHLETGVCGEWEMMSSAVGDMARFQRRVYFNCYFSQHPTVCVFLRNITALDNNTWAEIGVSAIDITKWCTTIELTLTKGCAVDGIEVGWLAYDSAEVGYRVQCGQITTLNGEWSHGKIIFNSSFPKAPEIFFGFHKLAVPHREVHIEPAVSEIGEGCFKYWVNAGEWDDPKKGIAALTWVAIYAEK